MILGSRSCRSALLLGILSPGAEPKKKNVKVRRINWNTSLRVIRLGYEIISGIQHQVFVSLRKPQGTHWQLGLALPVLPLGSGGRGLKR